MIWHDLRDVNYVWNHWSITDDFFFGPTFSLGTIDERMLVFCFNKTSCWDNETKSPDYLKQNSNGKYDCSAEVITINKTVFDPTNICNEDFFLPLVNSSQHIKQLTLLFQSLDLK